MDRRAFLDWASSAIALLFTSAVVPLNPLKSTISHPITTQNSQTPTPPVSTSESVAQPVTSKASAQSDSAMSAIPKEASEPKADTKAKKRHPREHSERKAKKQRQAQKVGQSAPSSSVES
ncbi:MAG: hypothetical protein HC790_00530 [Acaryochloridaceae cyanobacterium CSU_3_4]|nr:hypothetical protein [Acaryochloris sp. SU_5_25]NJN37534.1 hypothetical protein [Acaryochloridaceae cyanobacterium CSU_3_4]